MKFRRDFEMAESEKSEVKNIIRETILMGAREMFLFPSRSAAPNKEGFSWEWKEAKEFEIAKTGTS
jgi:hypothetical protein